MTTESHKETMGFQAEVKQLLKLVINSLYSNKEIFLRELVSNGADACDKLRFEGLSDDALYEDDPELKVEITFDKEAKTLVIEDNGIGMNRQEVMENIGTIARSGTKSFFEKLTGDQQQDSHLIGQFGVGFYSSFIIADEVTVETRRAGLGAEHGVRWVSGGEGDYTLETIDKARRGTRISMHLRDEEEEFLDNWKLKSLVHKYSEHITLPIMMEPDAPPPAEEGEEPKEVEPWEQVNKATALWTLNRNEISEEEYKEFYKSVGHDWQDPMDWVHARVEGNLEYTQLLYIPAKAPFDLNDRERAHGIKLYVRRVFIMEDTEKLMPTYMRFVRGVIDSNDLPLNVSREILQSSKIVDQIKKGSVKKVLGLLEGIIKKAEEGKGEEEYAKFWSEFGPVFKEGLIEDTSNQERIAKLCRFATSESEGSEQNTSLETYVERMKEGQNKIYFITAETYNGAKNSPHMEVFRKKGIEVLLLSDHVDEWVTQHLREFDGKSLQSITQGDLDLGELEDKDEKEELKKEEENFKKLIEQMKEVLSEEVDDIRVTNRLTDSPACLVAGAGAMDANMERIMKSMGQEVPGSKRIMEINVEHPLIERLQNETDDERFADWSRILFDQSLLAEGSQLDDPASFTRRLNGLLQTLAG
ncbi:MAG: molecular chaperone HtpG [Gammaproteobacteria bacterium]|jgi:molecular chaperone HtpG|nr:molecular chaperone HtpG [Gammaproteobacteria bacterium]MBT4606769.1 molecular chaperone HtpG [Thiotrichales bacterium]MBT3471235.1 molecular chaperone HtpG [Gammaproteobacteria bacterium]MBT3966113.1 molecular chaperone HtpG [Gammaproteobacteria bacterium]MBT4331358.1 molecular chaperone HtpG [Gammaproteobacteria bacterium]